MILIQNLKLKFPHDETLIKAKAAISLGVSKDEIRAMRILRRSLDARRKPELYLIYAVEVQVDQEHKVLQKALRNKKAKEQFSISDVKEYHYPEKQDFDENQKRKVVIVGAGPAGLFCAYYLAMAGVCPILLEQGKRVEDRVKDVEDFWKSGKLRPFSNVQFGEGGAGTFSDGKLNTLVKDKEGRNRAVLETFVRFGAKESILYDAKPHIGTDELTNVIKNMRGELLRLGTIISYETKVTGILTADEAGRDKMERVRGVILENGEIIPCKALVLAIGHSARDTFFMLREKGIQMEAKAFAVGFRVEHPQDMINVSQYGMKAPKELGAAAYKVTAKTSSGRGVYSFCMCPGGYVVNASSEEGCLAVNGMSYSGRDGKNANSAIIVSVSPDDFPDKDCLGGIRFQRELEQKAFQLAKGKIPVQRYGDFETRVTNQGNLDGSPTDDTTTKEIYAEGILEPQCRGEYAWADLSSLLPQECNQAFVEGMTQFGHMIKGFDRPDAILSGVESRTSSPVRIVRDESLQSISLPSLYPCGEGAGYAGGITSAGMDGLRVGEEILKMMQKD